MDLALDELERYSGGSIANHLFQRDDVVARHEAHPRHEWLKIPTVTFLSGHRQCTNGASVERVIERHDLEFIRRDGVAVSFSPY